MTGFSAQWLALREPFDASARELAWPTLSPFLPAIAGNTTAAVPASPLRVLDLACGSGANLRALAPRLGGSQRWRLVDHDPALLAELPGTMAAWAQRNGYQFVRSTGAGAPSRIDGPAFDVELVAVCADLSGGLDPFAIDEPHLVTASALLDLVSAPWIDALVHHARGAGAAVLCALTVDGRTEWNPRDPADADVERLFAKHQRHDKGFGPALGSSALAHAATALAAANYAVVEADSDWLIDAAGTQPHASAMLLAMLEGMAEAAIVQQPAAHAMVRSWVGRRMAVIGRTRLRVGHRELMAVPAQPPGSGPTTGRGPSETA